VFSPVPSQIVFELFGSTTTQHSVNDPPSSKIGVKVVPRLIVFHKPPNALATYQTFGSFGSMATSWMRPVASVGPMLRSSSGLMASAESDWLPSCRAPRRADQESFHISSVER
jgi:hypothetical protein